MKNFITFILPTHNEERNIIPLIKEILEFNINYEIEIIVVDDDSDDETQVLVKKLSKIFIQVCKKLCKENEEILKTLANIEPKNNES